MLIIFVCMSKIVTEIEIWLLLLKIRDGGSPKEIQIILREIIRILYCNGKIFQSEDDDQEDLKGLLLAASVLSKG